MRSILNKYNRLIESVWYSLVFLMAIAQPLFSQTQNSISGKVVDARSGMPLPGVNIQIQRSSMGTSSDLEGNYQINDLPVGSFTLTFSMMGYAPHSEKGIDIVEGLPVELDVKLNTNVLASPQVVVTSSRKEQDILESPFTISAIGSREIQSKAVVSMIDILEYEPGVSTVKGQLNIRGTSGYTLGAGTRSLLLLDGIPMWEVPEEMSPGPRFRPLRSIGLKSSDQVAQPCMGQAPWEAW